MRYYTVTVELSTPEGMSHEELRARILGALFTLTEMEDAPVGSGRIIVGHWHLDVPSEQGMSSKDAIRERAARAARLAAYVPVMDPKTPLSDGQDVARLNAVRRLLSQAARLDGGAA